MSFKTFLSLSLLSALTVGVVSHIASNEGEYERQYYAQLTPELVTITDPLGIGATDVTLTADCTNGTIRQDGNPDYGVLQKPEQHRDAYIERMSDAFSNPENVNTLADYSFRFFATQLERVCN